jgi:serine/threonine protein kinase
MQMPPGSAAERVLPDGFELTADLLVGPLLHRRGMINTYRCRDRSLNIDVLLKEYFPPRVAVRADDYTVAPASDPSRTLQDRKPLAPVAAPDLPLIPLTSTVIVRGWSGGDSSPPAIFAWGLNRFSRQAGVLAQLDHPGIERVFRVFSQNGTAYMTVQWTDGATLEDAVRVRAFSQDDLDLLLSTILDAISLMHERGIVHCDVAPRHILVKPDGKGVLTDVDPSLAAPNQGVRQEATMIMTPSYSPPEAYHGAPIAKITTDIYGLASSLYYAIARAAPPSDVMGDAPAPKLESIVEKGRYRTSFLRAIDWARSELADRPQSIEAWKRQLLAASRVVRLPPRQIFISYRRADSAAITRIIHQRLCSEFGAESIFFDVDTIPAGVDFRNHITGCIDMTAVVVAVVGRRWLRRQWLDWLGDRRRKTDDLVYTEIELALATDTIIIPVLVHGAEMPNPAKLPNSLQKFLYKNALKVRDKADQAHDLDRLVAAIRSKL